MQVYKPFILLFLLLHSFTGIAQTDTEFWFAAPDVIDADRNFDKPIRLFISTYSEAATVTVSQPAGSGMPTQTITIGASSSYSLDLTDWIGNIENTPANTVLNYGLHITSTKPITVYYEVVSSYCRCNPEIFVLKGKKALGTEFYIPGQTIISNDPKYDPKGYSSFDIVAVQDATYVTITPARNIVGHAAGVPFTVVLNKGQTYSATATGQTAIDHLQGSYVTSVKPIAVTCKDDVLQSPLYAGGCSDLTGEQIVPVPMLGTDYIASNGELNSPFDQLFVTATQNGTIVMQDGVTVANLNKGETKHLPVVNFSTYIHSSSPIYVYQISGIGCELGSTLLPKLGCTGSQSVAFARSTNYYLYITLIVKSGLENSFLINGSPNVVTPAMFMPVPGTGNQWLRAKVELPIAQFPKDSVIMITNTKGIFQCGMLEGSGSVGASMGYFSDYGTFVPSAGEPIQICNDTSFVFGNLTITDTGTYTQVFSALSGCDSIVSIRLASDFRPKSNYAWSPVIPDVNKPIQFQNLSQFATNYKWDFGDGTTSTEIDPLHMFPKTGTYKVCLRAINDNDCSNVFCQSVDAEMLPLIGVPTAFSPNGDGVNDVLYVKGYSIREFTFRIYNRWGHVIFETNDMAIGWDGSFAGKKQDMEVVGYTINAVYMDGTPYTKTGNITILK